MESNLQKQSTSTVLDILKPHRRKLARESDGNVDYA